MSVHGVPLVFWEGKQGEHGEHGIVVSMEAAGCLQFGCGQVAGAIWMPICGSIWPFMLGIICKGICILDVRALEMLCKRLAA